MIENNLVHSCQGSFDQHYGQDNIIRNNIFTLGSETQMRRLRPEEHSSFLFTGNIIYFTKGSVWAGADPDKGAVIDNNIYFDPERKGLDFGGYSFDEWQQRGQDRNSQIVDPRLADPENGDFSVLPDSPALKLGFIPFTCKEAGPRPEEQRNHLTDETRVKNLDIKNQPVG